MTENTMTIVYPDALLLSLKKSQDEFEAEARCLLAIKLYEMHRVLDEDIGVEGLMLGLKSGESQKSLGRWLQNRQRVNGEL